jgi:anti-sigma regulatory factor (Ser/Thr protein kinase)
VESVPLLIERFPIEGNDFERGGQAAAAVKAIMRELGFDAATVRRLSIANFEAEMNVIMYASRGVLEFTVLPDSVTVTLADEGPGIADVEAAMQEGFSTATAEMRARGFGAGMGLPNIRRNTDFFEILSTPGRGTTLRYGVKLDRGESLT